VDSGDLEGEKRADLGLPGTSGPGDGEAFLAKGLLRTDIVGAFEQTLRGGRKSWICR
jgi:hypothetical protein